MQQIISSFPHPLKACGDSTIIWWSCKLLLNLFKTFTYSLHFFSQVFQLNLVVWSRKKQGINSKSQTDYPHQEEANTRSLLSIPLRPLLYVQGPYQNLATLAIFQRGATQRQCNQNIIAKSHDTSKETLHWITNVGHIKCNKESLIKYKMIYEKLKMQANYCMHLGQCALIWKDHRTAQNAYNNSSKI